MKEKIKKINWKLLSLSLVAILVLFFMLVFIDVQWKTESIWKTPILTFIGAVQTSILATALWDYLAKKAFAKEMLELANISSNASESGLLYVYKDFLDIEWSKILENTKTLKLAVTYANTWRESNRAKLKAFIEAGNTVTVFLPDLHDDNVKKKLALRFETTSQAIEQKILTSYEGFMTLGATILLYKGCFQTTYYLFDDKAIMSVFNHKKEKGTVPSILVSKAGSLYKYINDELNAIQKRSSPKGEIII